MNTSHTSQTKQPDWEFIANLGDANPEEEGGVFLYKDRTGVYSPQVEVLEPMRGGRWRIYRFDIERCTFENGILSENKFHKDKPAWFAGRIESVAASCDHEKIIEHLCSEDIIDRARAYQSLWEYFGKHEFDHAPIYIDPLAERFTRGELPHRPGRSKA